MRDKRAGRGISSRDEPRDEIVDANESDTEGGSEGNFARFNFPEKCCKHIHDGMPWWTPESKE